MPVVRIEMLAGRSLAQKRELTRVITDAVCNIALARPEDTVTVDGLLVNLCGEDDEVRSRKEASSSMEEILRQNDVPVGTGTGAVEVQVKGPSQFGNIFGLLFNFLPLIIFGAILIFMMR